MYTVDNRTKVYIRWLVEVKDETVDKGLYIVAGHKNATCKWQELNFLYSSVE